MEEKLFFLLLLSILSLVTKRFAVMYAWQKAKSRNALSLQRYRSVLEGRREELLGSLQICSPEEYAESVVDEWMSLLKERDSVTREILRAANREQLERRLLSVIVSLRGLESADTDLLPVDLRKLLESSYKRLREYLSDSSGCDVEKLLSMTSSEYRPSLSDLQLGDLNLEEDAFKTPADFDQERAPSVSSQSSSMLGREPRLTQSQRFFPATLNARVLKSVPVVDSVQNLKMRNAEVNALGENDEID